MTTGAREHIFDQPYHRPICQQFESQMNRSNRDASPTGTYREQVLRGSPPRSDRRDTLRYCAVPYSSTTYHHFQGGHLRSDERSGRQWGNCLAGGW